jgi:hypothetical protein
MPWRRHCPNLAFHVRTFRQNVSLWCKGRADMHHLVVKSVVVGLTLLLLAAVVVFALIVTAPLV